jgi:hypothetical protein
MCDSKFVPGEARDRYRAGQLAELLGDLVVQGRSPMQAADRATWNRALLGASPVEIQRRVAFAMRLVRGSFVQRRRQLEALQHLKRAGVAAHSVSRRVRTRSHRESVAEMTFHDVACGLRPVPRSTPGMAVIVGANAPARGRGFVSRAQRVRRHGGVTPRREDPDPDQSGLPPAPRAIGSPAGTFGARRWSA